MYICLPLVFSLQNFDFEEGRVFMISDSLCLLGEQLFRNTACVFVYVCMWVMYMHMYVMD